MTPKGPDMTNPRIAWMMQAVGKGDLMKTIVGDGDYGRVDPATFFSRDRFPPTYFIHGTADTLVPSHLSQRAHDELVRNGHQSELVLVDGASHGLDARMQPGDEIYEIITKGLEYLKSHAKL